MAKQHLYDVIIVGAGPAGSAAAAFCARSGLSVLLLDRSRFPRDKVCGDGITPQALYWLDKLGCIDQVLDAAGTCITACNLYINGVESVVGKFPSGTPYPRFMTLLDRATFDNILRLHAIKGGAVMKENQEVIRVSVGKDHAEVIVKNDDTTITYSAKIVIGADGASSVIARSLGAQTSRMTRAISMRGYFKGVTCEPSSMRVYFDESYFPGYGWLFVDHTGRANAGVGCFTGPVFPNAKPVRELFNRFCSQELASVLSKAEPIGAVKGGWAPLRCTWRRSAERILLIGDAAACIDPLNGGGIHGALESAALASRVIVDAVSRNDLSEQALSSYDELLQQYHGDDYAVGNMLTTYAQNNHASPLYLALLKRIAAMAEANPRFGEFAAGIFTGMIPQRYLVSPQMLMSIMPGALQDYRAALFTSILSTGAGIARGCLGVTRGAVADPVQFYRWFSQWVRDSARVAQTIIGS
jgi:geranylgeranyl reductase family protein